MVQGTTTHIGFKMADTELLDLIETARISVKVLNTCIEKAGDDIVIDKEAGTISANFTQEETYKLSSSNGYAQLAIKLEDGTVMKTKKKPIEVEESISKEVM